MSENLLRPLSIAILSDLHVGYGARSRDLSPYDDHREPESKYRRTFLEFLRRDGIYSDFLIIPGDVSHEAKPVEFTLATEVALEIADLLSIPEERVLFVPGNHDVDWAVMAIEDSTGFRKGQRFDTMSCEGSEFGGWAQSKEGTLLDEPHFNVVEFEDMITVRLNSACADGPEESIHHGFVAPETVELLNTRLQTLAHEDQRLRLFIVHHHPIQYSEPILDHADFSTIVNAPKLLEVLQNHRFDILIHGHKHHPHFQTLSIDAGFPIAMLGAGSFSAILETRWSGLVNNQFHLLQVRGRDSEQGCVYGDVLSWAYISSQGWVPSQTHNGILHRNPFGRYFQPQQLEIVLNTILGQHFGEHDYVKWSDICINNELLTYLPPKILIGILDRLAEPLEFTRHGESPEEIILLKRRESE